MNRHLILLPSLLFLAINATAQIDATNKSTETLRKPPYHGTIFIAPDIFRDSDPTAFESLTYVGLEPRRMFDRRTDRHDTVEAHIFTATFDDGLTAEVRVNAEFDREQAEKHARRYLIAVGQLPKFLRLDINHVNIHGGDKLFGGGGGGLLIHTVQGRKYRRDGILTETLFHEATHTSIDHRHARDERWLAAQKADGNFISTYARDNPTREDLAETLLLSFAYVHRRDRLPEGMAGVLEATIPNRIKYFASLKLDIHPLLSENGPKENSPPQNP